MYNRKVLPVRLLLLRFSSVSQVRLPISDGMLPNEKYYDSGQRRNKDILVTSTEQMYLCAYENAYKNDFSIGDIEIHTEFVKHRPVHCLRGPSQLLRQIHPR